MATFKVPGPLCTSLGALPVDGGTLCRHAMPAPLPSGTASLAAAEVKSTAPALPLGKLGPSDFAIAAASLSPKVKPAVVRAFAEVESGGKSGFGPGGRPVIAYEGHWFHKLTDRVYDQQYPLLSYPYKRKAGPEWQVNNKDQATAWATLNQAMKLNRSAALQSCSWGMFQVMGFNYRACGYPEVESFVEDMRAGEAGQLRAFVSYCRKTKGLIAAMEAADFATMALLYNGPDFGDYDQRMQKNYERYI